jgi:hypothetical protein|nr:MAG TPA: hypothetical protein [Caudoviricetes sp.]
MEIKAELKQPYTEDERIEFIVEQNHKLGYTIEEQEDKLVALGYTDEEKAKAERERLDNLSMTRGDVFEALILAKRLSKAQIRAMIEQASLDDITKALYLNRFDEALEFYRGYPIFDMLGQALNITSEMLDKFFDTKDYHYLTTCKLTINVVPEESTVTINDIEQKEVTIPYSSQVTYKIDCEGYKSVEEVLTLTEDKTLEITLEKIEDDNTTATTDNADTVQDELQSETD